MYVIPLEEGHEFESLPQPPQTFYVLGGKRLLDVAVGGALLVISLPVQLAVACLVKLQMGTPVLFHQRRPGLRAEPFQLKKFRTMTDERDAAGNRAPDRRRITRVGGFLRATSLDELPGLVNVMRGHMSLVGPRPLHMKYLDRYTPRQAARHGVRPGVTGLAQVSGRNALTWNEKFELDLLYVENVSLGFDLRILWRTLWQVLTRNGIAAHAHATMPEFTG